MHSPLLYEADPRKHGTMVGRVQKMVRSGSEGLFGIWRGECSFRMGWRGCNG